MHFVNIIFPSIFVFLIWVAENSKLLVFILKICLQGKIIIWSYLFRELDQSIVVLYGFAGLCIRILVGYIDALYLVGPLQPTELAWVDRKKPVLYPLPKVVKIMGAS